MNESRKKCFISYSWDDESHSYWINKLARILKENGVDVKIDQWDLFPGSDLNQSLKELIHESDFVLVVCTEKYKHRVINNLGGVGFESQVLMKLVDTSDFEKIIPVLRFGDKNSSIPDFLSKKLYLDFRNDDYISEFQKLLEHFGIKQSFVTPFLGEVRYTVLEHSDISHGLAKRYRSNILLEGCLDKGAIKRVIIEINNKFRQSNYYRNKLAEARWQEKEADTISLFMYKSIQDLQHVDWICRTQWMHPNLEKSGRLMEMKGETISDGTVVDWNDNHGEYSEYFKKNILSKEEYLKSIIEIMDNLTPLVHWASELIDKYEQKTLSISDLDSKLGKKEEEVLDLYMSIGDISGPFECRELDQRFSEYIAVAHNVFLPFAGRGSWEEVNKIYLAKSAIQDARKTIQYYNLELEKVR